MFTVAPVVAIPDMQIFKLLGRSWFPAIAMRKTQDATKQQLKKKRSIVMLATGSILTVAALSVILWPKSPQDLAKAIVISEANSDWNKLWDEADPAEEIKLGLSKDTFLRVCEKYSPGTKQAPVLQKVLESSYQPSDELATVTISFKAPDGENSILSAQVINKGNGFVAHQIISSTIIGFMVSRHPQIAGELPAENVYRAAIAEAPTLSQMGVKGVLSASDELLTWEQFLDLQQRRAVKSRSAYIENHKQNR